MRRDLEPFQLAPLGRRHGHHPGCTRKHAATQGGVEEPFRCPALLDSGSRTVRHDHVGDPCAAQGFGCDHAQQVVMAVDVRHVEPMRLGLQPPAQADRQEQLLVVGPSVGQIRERKHLDAFVLASARTWAGPHRSAQRAGARALVARVGGAHGHPVPSPREPSA
jgi:hypothetical protein